MWIVMLYFDYFKFHVLTIRNMSFSQVHIKLFMIIAHFSLQKNV